DPRHLHSFPTRRSSDLQDLAALKNLFQSLCRHGAASIIPAQVWESLFAFKDCGCPNLFSVRPVGRQVRAKSTTRQLHLEGAGGRSEEHTSELQSLAYLV